MTKQITKTEIKEVTVKRYTVIKGKEILLITDQLKEADKEVKKMMIENEEFIQIRDAKTGININYEKTRYQKNYRIQREKNKI